MEQNKASVLYQTMMEQKTSFGLPDSLREQESIDRNLLDQYRKSIFAMLKNPQTLDSTKLKADQQQVVLYEGKLNQLRNTIKNNYPQLFKRKYQSEFPTVTAVRSHLQDHKQAFMEFFRGKEFLYVLVVTEQHVVLTRTNVDEGLLQSIKDYHNCISQPVFDERRDQLYFESASRLYHTLIEKPLEGIRDSINALILVADAELNAIPFASMLRNKPSSTTNVRYADLDYLIKDFTVSYLYSAKQMLQQTSLKSEAERSWIGFAPVYQEQQVLQQVELTDLKMRGNNWDLPFAREEVSTIADMMDGDPITSLDASKTTFIENAAQYSIIHLATHGYLDRRDPLYHKLVFASDQSKENELYAYEIYDLQLNCEMAVLSACNTASGQLEQGEGVMSLARAFTFAGAKSLITTQWQIYDRSSSDIMVRFYENLKEGKRKDVGLRNAQLGFLKAQDENIYAHPYFWAAYVSVGDTQGILSTLDSKKLIYLLVLVPVVFLIFYWLLKNRRKS
ncbi:MAG: CHAT domain-containing protein, partial [Bacteroidota bacterium]